MWKSSSSSAQVESPLHQIASLNPGRKAKRAAALSKSKKVSSGDVVDVDVDFSSTASNKRVEHVIVQDRGTQLKNDIDAIETEIKNIDELVAQYDEADEEFKTILEDMLAADNNNFPKMKKRKVELTLRKIKIAAEYNNKNMPSHSTSSFNN